MSGPSEQILSGQGRNNSALGRDRQYCRCRYNCDESITAYTYYSYVMHIVDCIFICVDSTRETEVQALAEISATGSTAAVGLLHISRLTTAWRSLPVKCRSRPSMPDYRPIIGASLFLCVAITKVPQFHCTITEVKLYAACLCTCSCRLVE